MTRGPHAARYTICCRVADEAAAVRAALQVEVDDPLGGATVSLRDVVGASESFVLQVDADDLVHLRAASRSYLHWAQAATRSLRGAGAAAAASDESGPGGPKRGRKSEEESARAGDGRLQDQAVS